MSSIHFLNWLFKKIVDSGSIHYRRQTVTGNNNAIIFWGNSFFQPSGFKFDDFLGGFANFENSFYQQVKNRNGLFLSGRPVLKTCRPM